MLAKGSSILTQVLQNTTRVSEGYIDTLSEYFKTYRCRSGVRSVIVRSVEICPFRMNHAWTDRPFRISRASIGLSIGRWHGSCIDRSVDRSSRMSRASIGRSVVGMRRASIGQFASIGRSAIGHESCTDRPIRIDRASIGPSAVGHESRIDRPIGVSRPWSAARSVVPHESCIGPSAVQLGRSSAERTGHGRATWPSARVMAERLGRAHGSWPSDLAERVGRSHGSWPANARVVTYRSGRAHGPWPRKVAERTGPGRAHGP